MKKIALVFSLLFGLSFMAVKKVHAALPQDQGAQLSGAFSHTQIFGSSFTVNSTSVAVTVPAVTNYQNCFTRFIIQESTVSLFTVYDGTGPSSNPIFNIQGAALGGGPSANTFNYAEDHLGPICGSMGNATFIFLSTGTSTTGDGKNNTFNYEGYTSAGPGSSRN